MAVTIKDVARAAGVSYSTVSRALNGVGSGNNEKRQRIIRIAEEMGYMPNQAAINLKKCRSYNIGLYFSTISRMSSPYVLHEVLMGVYNIAGSQYNVVVKGIDMHKPGTLNPSFFDGIIVLSQRNEDILFIEEVHEKDIPMVIICRTVFFDAPNVTTDEAEAMGKAMELLIQNGHRRICVIEGNANLDSTKERHRGWRVAMLRNGLDPDTVPVYQGNYRYTSGYQAANQILEQGGELPTAILCFNDEMAFGARNAIYEHGLTVPDDISLTGFDNWDLSGYANMRLTTVERNMGEIAKEGTRVLLRRLDEGIIDNSRIYLENKLIIRDTVKNLNQ
ncbi:MAG: LacI family DNA-binding transcriptional regulator [Lachnospiraceae bacterium]|nr:LacI family DNA-binding transcriptional regulator [Lachnospiraceae bacterium]